MAAKIYGSWWRTNCLIRVYVREILKISRATEAAELHELAQRIEALHPLLPRVKFPKTTRDEEAVKEEETEAKYLYSLR